MIVQGRGCAARCSRNVRRWAMAFIVAAAAFSGTEALAALGYRIEAIKVGPLSPTSSLVQARVSINGSAEMLTRAAIESSLRELLKSVREQHGQKADVVTVYLYVSSTQYKNGDDAIAKGESTPVASESGKPGRFEETLTVWSVPAEPVASAVSQLSLDKRKQIYYELMGAVDRAERETIEKYGSISVASVKAEDELIAKYQGQVAARYRITKDERWSIIKEATAQHWPSPSR